MSYTSSRGWRNNNHLNIRRSASRWQGLAETQTDKAFCQFVSPAYGYRAAIKTLQSYQSALKKKGQVFNIKNIINRWAPASDGNHPLTYAAKVATHSMVDPHIALPSPNTPEGALIFARIMGAMCLVETGCPRDQIPWPDIRKGIYLAYDIHLAGKPYEMP